MNILMFYYYTPGTTAWYLEKAFRRLYDVRTCGPQVLGIPHHDITLRTGALNINGILKKLHKEMKWKPDIFIMVDSGHTLYPKGICALPIPAAYYAIDTHISLYTHQALAPLFDFVFIAQKEYVERLKRAGARYVIWLPLACDPNVHKHYDAPKIYDICFLGYRYGVREQFLQRLAKRFNLYIGWVHHTKMTYIYSQSKIVFNKSIGNDINMRIFEAMASGSLLLTNRLNNNGLEELFTDKKDLVLYNEDDLEELADYYLSHEEERERIATSGFNKVCAFHTYDHRVDSIIKIVKEHTKVSFNRPSQLFEEIALKRVRFLQSRLGKWWLKLYR